MRHITLKVLRHLFLKVTGEAEIKFEIVPQAELKAKGGYAQSKDTIFLAAEFLERKERDIESISEVILEELGHYLDSRLNQTDTKGDEGAVFAALTLGKEIDDKELLAIEQEDDSATVTIGGEILEIEQAEVDDLPDLKVTNLNLALVNA